MHNKSVLKQQQQQQQFIKLQNWRVVQSQKDSFFSRSNKINCNKLDKLTN